MLVVADLQMKANTYPGQNENVIVPEEAATRGPFTVQSQGQESARQSDKYPARDPDANGSALADVGLHGCFKPQIVARLNQSWWMCVMRMQVQTGTSNLATR